MKDLLERVQRELPDTDRDRYDVAYERGRAQARSSLLAGGMAVGSIVGAGLMWALDPVRGAARRAALAERLRSFRESRGSGDGGGDGSSPIQAIKERLQGSPVRRRIGQRPDDVTVTVVTASKGTTAVGAADYGEGYREGFGQTEHDPTAPGSQVPDPIQPTEVQRYGSSGPVAGATMETDTDTHR